MQQREGIKLIELNTFPIFKPKTLHQARSEDRWHIPQINRYVAQPSHKSLRGTALT